MGNILSSSSEFDYSIIEKDSNQSDVNSEYIVITEQPKKQEERINRINYKDNTNKTCCNVFSNTSGIKNKYNKLVKKHDILIEKYEKLKKEHDYLLNKKNL